MTTSNSYFSYDILEERIKRIKNDVENLCFVVDQIGNSESIEDSSSSYHTAISGSTLSLDSFVSAVDHFEDSNDNAESPSICEKIKKTVSFSNQVTVLQVLHRKRKKGTIKTKLGNVKNKLINYFDREKLYLKYKFNIMKDNIMTKYKSNKTPQEEPETTVKLPVTISAEFGNKERQNESIINLQTFFNENVDNFVLETDIDDDSLSLVCRQCSFTQTDLSPMTVSIYNSHLMKVSENKSIIKELGEEMKSLPTNRTNYCQSLPKVNSFNTGDILFKYLISKAQSPIELKVAYSIAKLNLPLWYQSTLIV